MKKLLGILGALGLTATASSTVIACGDEMHPGFIDYINDESNIAMKNNHNYDKNDKQNLWLIGTRFVFETKEQKQAHLRIFFSKDLTSLKVNDDAELAKHIHIYKGNSSSVNDKSSPIDIGIEANDVYFSGSWMNVKLSKDVKDKFKTHEVCTVTIDQDYLPYKATANTGETDDEHISFGPSFTIPGPDNI